MDHRKWFYGEAGNRTCDPRFTRHRFIPYTTAVGGIKKLFVDFLGINQVRRVGLRYVCWFYDGKPGIKSATPGLQDIGLPPT